MHGGLSQLLFTGLARHRLIARYIADHRDLCLPSSTPTFDAPVRRVRVGILAYIALAFDTEKLECFGYPLVQKIWLCFVPFFSYLTLNNIVTLKSGLLEVTQDHSNWYHLKAWMLFPIR